MTGTKQQLHQNRILSVFLPPSLPQIRWSREIYLAKLSPQKLGKGIQKRRKILFETRKAPPPIPLLVLSPRIPAKGSFASRCVPRESRSSPLVVEDGKLRLAPVLSRDPSLPSPFLSPISISLSRRSLDPIISCPLSGSVCYAIGLRGLDRRAVCFVSLIAVRGGLSPVVLSLSLSLSLLPLPLSVSLSLSLARSPSSPFSSLSPATSLLLRRGRHFIFKKRPASVHFRPFSTQPRLPAPLSLFLSILSLLLPFSLSPTFGRVAAPRMVAPWPTAILTAMRLERKRNWTTRMERARPRPRVRLSGTARENSR